MESMGSQSTCTRPLETSVSSQKIGHLDELPLSSHKRHNDIKANNVALHKCSNGEIAAILLDFGKATFVHDVTEASALAKDKQTEEPAKNRLRHIAAEAVKSPASDIFSLGVLMKDVSGALPLVTALYRRCKAQKSGRLRLTSLNHWRV